MKGEREIDRPKKQMMRENQRPRGRICIVLSR